MNGMRRGSVAAAACVFTLATAGTAQAADIQVTAGAGDGVASDGQCSLREAINSASDNGLGSAVGCVQGETALDVIHLPAGTYQLSAGGSDDTNAGGDLDVQGTVRITHDGAGVATIMGDGQDRVLDVQPAAAAELHGVTITGGRTLDGASSPSATGGGAEPGGGIRNRGSLALVDSTVSGNATGNGGDGATGGKAGDGGGVYASDLVTISGSTIEDNTTGDGGTGGLGTNDRGGFGGRGGRGG